MVCEWRKGEVTPAQEEGGRSRGLGVSYGVNLQTD